MEKQYYKEYYELERYHWWFRARLEILEKILVKKNLAQDRSGKILNAGAATGATSIMLKRYGDVISLEYDKECSEFLAGILGEKVVNASLTQLPFENNSFEMVCAFDVIEHIENDDLSIKEIKRVLKESGMAYITVPAFNFLWSSHDDINHHFRRYTRKSLLNLLRKNGFEISFCSYFNFWLFPPISAIRLLSKFLPKSSKKDSTGSDFEKFNSKGILNKILFRLFKSEALFLKRGMSFPFGVSIVIVAKKSSEKNGI